MKIEKIGIENFRVFKEMTEFQLRPLTILTGPNNSGKSSFSKFLLLLNNGLETLDFSKGEHYLEGFEQVLNWDNQHNKEITVRLNAPELLPPEFHMDLTYSNKNGDWVKDCTIKVHNNEDTLYEVRKWIGSETLNDYNDVESFLDVDGTPIHLEVGAYEREQEVYNLSISFNIRLLIDLLYSKNIMVEKAMVEENENLSLIKFAYPEEKTKQVNFLNFNNYGDPKQFRTLALSNEIDVLERNYLLYDVYIDGKLNTTKVVKELVLETQEEMFKNYVLKLDVQSDHFLLRKSYTQIIAHCFKSENYSSFNNNVKKGIADIIREKYGIEKATEIRIEETKLGTLIFKQKLFSYSSKEEWEIAEFQSTFFEILSPTLSYFSDFNKSISPLSVSRISANRGSQKRVLQNKGENEMDEVVTQWVEKGKPGAKWVQQILSILEIEGEFDAKRIENTIAIAFLKRTDKEINLVDLGFGYTQILVMVLKMIVIYESNSFLSSNEIIIIEEPEANLHPNLQSKLAEVFVLLTNKFSDLTGKSPKFIIETHSEYFIRKLQYLVAKKGISTGILEKHHITKKIGLQVKKIA